MKHLLFLSILIFFSTMVKAQSRASEARTLYEEALSVYRAGHFGDAVDAIEQSVYWRPSADSYYLSGLIYEARDEVFKAIAAYEATVQIEPEHNEAIFQKAILYLGNGDAEIALKDFNILIDRGGFKETRGLYFQIDPSGSQQNQIVSMSNLESKLHYYRGQAHVKLGNYREALSDFDESLIFESSVDVLINRGLLYDKMGDENLAVSDLKKAVELNPESHLAWYNLAILDSAVDIPEEILADKTFSPILQLLGAWAMEAQDYDLAKKYYDQSLQNNPENAEVLINRGRALMGLEKYSKSREDFEQARSLDESVHEALYLIANSYFLDHKFSQAIVYYNLYLATDASDGAIWYNGAMCYLQMKKHEEACYYLKRATSLGMEQAVRMKDEYCK